jgi:hypothetical protein
MKKIALVVLLLVPFMGFTQNIESVKSPWIEVSGTAEKEVIPDEIYISITLKERTEGRDKITIEKLESELREAITKLGIKSDQLVVSNLSAGYGKIKWKQKDVLTEKEFSLKLKDANILQKIFSALDGLLVHKALIDRVDYSKMELLKKEVRINAVNACKEKATYMLEALNEKIGPVIYINEMGMPYIENANVNQSMGFMEARLNTGSGNSDEEDYALDFKKIKVQVTVNARFSILR